MNTDETRQILDAIGEVKNEQVATTFQIENLANRVQIQNGRIGKLEDFKQAFDLAQAHASGVREGKSGMVVSRKLVAGFFAIMSAVVGLTGGIVAVVMQVL